MQVGYQTNYCIFVFFNLNLSIMRILTVMIIVLLFAGCTHTPEHSELKQGVWRGVLDIQGHDLPFNFAVQKDSTGQYNVYVKNGRENLLLDSIKFEDDSVVFVMHIFDSELKAAITGDSLKGYFIKNYENNYRLPFLAAHDQDFRFAPTKSISHPDAFTGKYSVMFTNNTDTTQAVGMFMHYTQNIVEGTFLTPTGDYRFLEGNIIDDTLHLSTFDGNHAYLFTAVKNSDSTLTGEYWSGKTWHQSWVGVKNENASLPDPESMTILKAGYDKIDFSFPDADHVLISPSDEKYTGKVLILQLLGTWCPNCMDETKFLSSWYDKNKDRGVEIIGLAYEMRDDFDYASGHVKKMIDKLGVDYDVVIAGTQDKDAASKTLPALKHVVAFPTTIFIGKDGKVRKIHTGFTGPGTGIYYQQFVEHFNEIVNELLSEKTPS